ncbi:MAG: hypothetical protein ACR2RF_24275 [Geminicoccaceae bacterium]
MPIGFRPSSVLLAVVVGTAILTYIIIKPAVTLVGLRVSAEVEIEGQDAATRCTVDLAAERFADSAISGRKLSPCLGVSAALSRSSC